MIETGKHYEIGHSGAICRVDEQRQDGTFKVFVGSKTWLVVSAEFLNETTETKYCLPYWLKTGYSYKGKNIQEIKRGPIVMTDGTIYPMLDVLLSHSSNTSSTTIIEEETIEEEESGEIPTISISAEPTETTEEESDNAYGVMDKLFKVVEKRVIARVVNAVSEMLKPYLTNLNKVRQQVITIKVGNNKHTFPKGHITHCKLERVIECVGWNIPVYLFGPAGSGKNDLVKDVCAATGKKFYYLSSVTTEDKLVGYMDAGGNYHETEFYRAMKSGGILMLDELDASCPDTLVIANSAIANHYFTFPNGERLQAHEDFRVIAAGNTYGRGADDDYTGRQPLDAATMNRFAIIKVDYDPQVESNICGGDEQILEFCRNLRKSAQNAGIKISPISYRTIIMLDNFRCSAAPLSEQLEMAVLKGEDKDTIRNLCRSYSGNKENTYYKAMLTLS